jgi:hypothetical protein
LAISLVVAANFAFAQLKPNTKENLYGETIIKTETKNPVKQQIIKEPKGEGIYKEPKNFPPPPSKKSPLKGGTRPQI